MFAVVRFSSQNDIGKVFKRTGMEMVEVWKFKAQNFVAFA